MSGEQQAPQKSELQKARTRALLTLLGTLVAVGVAYLYYRSAVDLPMGSCETSSQCVQLGGECLHAPTGSYCTHTCNRDEDCDPGMHCDTPPWENGATRTVCLRDSKKATSP